jgi:DNA-binding CsgD family transcriptional regulator/tetratricopeptide (TPR) repeat protein
MTARGLLERDEVLAGVEPVLEGARGGRASVLFVLADAGLGKSEVLDHAVRSAGGFEVLAAHGERADVALPFGYLTQALCEAGAPDLAATESDLPAAERPGANWSRLRRWLEEPRSEPLLFALDDLHWADPDSLSLLRLVVRHIRDVPVAIVAAMRSWPAAAADLATALAQDGLAALVHLAPLSPSASAQLVASLTGRSDDAALVAQVQDCCAGNPLLIHQLARSLEDDQLARVPGAGRRGARLLLGRFTGLDSAGLDFARAAAVCGVQFSPAIAGALAGLDETQIRTALAGLCGAGLLREADGHGGASFVHALVRRTLYDDIPAPLRGQLHAAAFRLLWERGAPAGEAGVHALAADLVGDPAAVAATERAGTDALACGALEAAGQWLRDALRLAGERAEPGLRLRLAEALHACGDPVRAAQVCRGLLAEAEAEAEAGVGAGVRGAWAGEAHRLLGRMLFELGETTLAEESLRRGAACALPANRRLAVEALLEGSLLGMYTSGPRRALDFAHAAHRLLDDGTDAQLAAWVLVARGHARMLMADPGGAADVESGLGMLPGGSGIRGLHGSAAWGPRLVQLQTAKFTEHFDEAQACFDSAMAEAKRTAVPLALSIYAVAHADTLSRLGRLVEARTLLLQAMDGAPWFVGRVPWVTVGLAHVHFELDQAERAEQQCAQIEGMIGAEGDSLPLLRFWLWRVRAGLALQRNDTESACEVMDRALATAEHSGTYEPGAAPWYPTAVTTYVHAGRLADAEAVLERLEATFAGSSRRWARAVAARGRALLAERAGDPAAAERHFSDAEAWHETLPMPLEHAETLLAAGSFLRRAGAPTRARETLGRAAQIATACGARRLERLSLDELHAAGGRRPRRPLNQITPIERRVATLAAAGLTNAEIARQLMMSARTVEHHLTHVYSTLAITSRRSLRRVLANTPASDRARVDLEAVTAP